MPPPTPSTAPARSASGGRAGLAGPPNPYKTNETSTFSPLGPPRGQHGSQEGTRTPPRHSKRVPRGARTVPRGAPEVPGRPRRAPGESQVAQRGLQGALWKACWAHFGIVFGVPGPHVRAFEASFSDRAKSQGEKATMPQGLNDSTARRIARSARSTR